MSTVDTSALKSSLDRRQVALLDNSSQDKTPVAVESLEAFLGQQ
jgi:hypothetical protein